MTDDMIIIGISDQNTGRHPAKLVTYALGSCVGIALHDKETGLGGLAHIMLPDSSIMNNPEKINRMKYADTAIVDLYNSMIKQGANPRGITAKLAGGANMFKVPEDSPIGKIGIRNVKRSKEVLGELNIPIVAEDVGKDFGRTLYFDLDTGTVRVQSLGQKVKEI
jgi:chemotaxis protein CheD